MAPRLSCAAICVAICATTVAAQRTIQVPRDVATIQGAIRAASGGDTILVEPGIYRENIDFLGKGVTVRSLGGAAQTTIDGGAATAVTFASNEPRSATLDGFTLAGRNNSTGRSISCARSSPTILNNVLDYAKGGRGIDCRDPGSPRIENNQLLGIGLNIVFGSTPIVRGNRIANLPFGKAVYVYLASPILDGNTIENSGEYLSTPYIVRLYTPSPHRATFVNNLVVNNTVTIQSSVVTVLGQVTIVNNTIVGNESYRGNNAYAAVSGLVTSPSIFSNNILRNKVAYEVIGFPSVTHCNLKGGHAGVGNIDADPLFLDGVLGDYHLRYDSPCRDVGGSSLSARDRDGDPRPWGRGVDIGCDEFHPRIYATGNLTPGGTLHVKILAPPGASVAWAYSLQPTLLDPPLSVPGLGNLWLRPPIQVHVEGATTPSTGVVIIPIPLPPGLPRGDYPLQALIGSKLSNVHILRIR